MDLGARIRRARKAADLSQEEVARRAGIGVRAMNSLETGRARDPHYSTLQGIANALGVPLEELLKEEEPALAGKAEAPEAGQPQRRVEIVRILPLGEPLVSREDLEALGITITDPELDSLNGYLESLQRSGGGPAAIVSLGSDKVSHDRIRRLAEYVLATGILSRENHEAVVQGLQRKLAAG